MVGSAWIRDRLIHSHLKQPWWLVGEGVSIFIGQAWVTCPQVGKSLSLKVFLKCIPNGKEVF